MDDKSNNGKISMHNSNEAYFNLHTYDDIETAQEISWLIENSKTGVNNFVVLLTLEKKKGCRAEQ